MKQTTKLIRIDLLVDPALVTLVWVNTSTQEWCKWLLLVDVLYTIYNPNYLCRKIVVDRVSAKIRESLSLSCYYLLFLSRFLS